MLNTPTMTKPIITKLAAKIRGEMKELSSDSHSSILRDSVEAVKKFHWETVRLELIQKMPSLMSLLSQVIGRSKERSSLLCLIAARAGLAGKTRRIVWICTIRGLSTHSADRTDRRAQSVDSGNPQIALKEAWICQYVEHRPTGAKRGFRQAKRSIQD